MTISEWLKANNRNAKWLAEEVKISEAQLSRIRNRISPPSWKTAERISKATGGSIRPEELMFQKCEAPKETNLS